MPRRLSPRRRAVPIAPRTVLVWTGSALVLAFLSAPFSSGTARSARSSPLRRVRSGPAADSWRRWPSPSLISVPTRARRRAGRQRVRRRGASTARAPCSRLFGDDPRGPHARARGAGRHRSSPRCCVREGRSRSSRAVRAGRSRRRRAGRRVLRVMRWDGLVPAVESVAEVARRSRRCGAAWAFSSIRTRTTHRRVIGDRRPHRRRAVGFVGVAGAPPAHGDDPFDAAAMSARASAGSASCPARVGAIASRSLVYWLRDRRYIMNMVVVPVAGVICDRCRSSSRVCRSRSPCSFPCPSWPCSSGGCRTTTSPTTRPRCGRTSRAGVHGVSPIVSGGSCPSCLSRSRSSPIAVPFSVALHGDWGCCCRVIGLCAEPASSRASASRASSRSSRRTPSRGRATARSSSRSARAPRASSPRAPCSSGPIVLSAPAICCSWRTIAGDAEATHAGARPGPRDRTRGASSSGVAIGGAHLRAPRRAADGVRRDRMRRAARALAPID